MTGSAHRGELPRPARAATAGRTSGLPSPGLRLDAPIRAGCARQRDSCYLARRVRERARPRRRTTAP